MDLEAILAYIGWVLIVNGISLIPSIQGAIKEKHFTPRDRSVLNAILIAGNGIVMVVVNPNAIVFFIGAILIIIGLLCVLLIVKRSIDSFSSLLTFIILVVVILIQKLAYILV